MAEIEDLHPNLSTNLRVFSLKIGHQNLSFSTDFSGLRHNFSLICYLPHIISILQKNLPEKVANS